ncbi:MAG: DEAD/DEAH box helicase family protein [Candidatus Hatepunaea meridiana]|nr:DEAD/DEAH box helicase family protein [Candidatus Hatepunaea meridiana]
MQLKNYQIRTLREFEAFLVKLRQKEDALTPLYPTLKAVGSALPDPAETAWKEIFPQRPYVKRVNAVNEPVPNICFKIPTGGGKTLLACHALGSLSRVYRHSNSGMVLWIVPTEQIYKQTLKALKDRSHPYREALDKASGGRTKIVEKSDTFAPEDVRDSLVVLLMMLQSANRRNQDYLKTFRDSGKFQQFFPEEGRYDLYESLIAEHGLDVGISDMFNRRGARTSLGNVMKMLRPVMILDEGQKASSFLARETIFSLNPSLVIELTATPIDYVSNTLVGIGGLDVLEEGMIKLDMHVTTKASEDWKDTMRESLAKWEYLVREAEKLLSNDSVYIRPICLIQAERTGKNQRDGSRVHSEDVRDFLIKEAGRSPEEVAVKVSGLDELGDSDLLSPDCPINFIITKHALQEGWDCPFAYVLTILTNPKAKLAITQLVGRILRQPYATKTGVAALDESYVICRRSSTHSLMDEIRNALKSEGLGDLDNQIRADIGDGGARQNLIEIGYRERFRHLADNIYLPRFVIDKPPKPRSLDYEMDLLSSVDWSDFDLSFVDSYSLVKVNAADIEEAISLAENPVIAIKRTVVHKNVVYLEPDPVFLARQISDIVPNPWSAFSIAQSSIETLTGKYDYHQVGANLNMFIEELRQRLFIFRDKQAHNRFKQMLEDETLRFYLIKDSKGKPHKKPTKLISSDIGFKLAHSAIDDLQRSLFEVEDRREYNELEKDIALCLDKQAKLLFWYRNISRAGYSVQGWQENRIFPDFLAHTDEVDDSSTVYVIESKGTHLADFSDTKYKEMVFKTINDIGKVHEWTELGLKFPEQKFIFRVVHQASWAKQIEEMTGM